MISSLPPGWLGYLIGLIGIIFPFAVSWRKGKVDESAMILGKWKAMVDQHAEDIKDLRDELRKEREENQKLRDRMTKQEDRHAEELRKRDSEIENLKRKVSGLERQIIQNSESTAQLLSDPAALAITRTMASRRKKENGG